MSKSEANRLGESLIKWGDLSGFVYNTRLDRIVSGHQRAAMFDRMGGEKKIVITQKFEPMMADKTTAIGYITYQGRFYNYREVDFTEAEDIAANSAANHISGDDDLEKLASQMDVLRDLDQDLLALTGLDDDELAKLQQLGNEPESQAKDDDGQSMSFHLTNDQYDAVNEALMYITAKNDLNGLPSKDMYGNALYIMSRQMLDRVHEQENETQPPAFT